MIDVNEEIERIRKSINDTIENARTIIDNGRKDPRAKRYIEDPAIASLLYLYDNGLATDSQITFLAGVLKMKD